MERKSLLQIFITHPVAMNILMAMFLVIGTYVITRINTQFFPSFTLNYVNVLVAWPGASAEDVERSVTNRLELELKNTNNLKDMRSTSSYSVSNIILEFYEGTDIGVATDDVKSTVDRLIPDLPNDAERPVVSEFILYEGVAKLIVSGHSITQLRTLANQFKDQLLALGIGKIDIIGLPDEEISIQVPGQTLRDLGLSLNQIGDRIRSHSQDTSIGILGRDDVGRELRIIDQRRSELTFEDVPIIADSEGRLVVLSDIATIQQRPKHEQVALSYNNRPAAVLNLLRQDTSDTLESADIFYQWLSDIRPTLSPGVELSAFDDDSIALRDRIEVLVNNGIAGLVLVLIVLYLFLNARVAFWVAAGIPISLLGAVTILYLLGGSLNMLTLFAFIMTIGIIVDDAIVVGEESLTNFVRNPSPTDAVYRAARRMFMPILTASLTTIFAFVPVVVVEGVIGKFLASIAIVVICVVFISLIEAFLILPGHLRHTFDKSIAKGKALKTSTVDRYFIKFRDGIYRKCLNAAITNPITTITIGIACLIVTIGLFASGRIQYSFFPTPELNSLWVNVNFNAGTPEKTVHQYLKVVEDALIETERALGGDLISTYFVVHGANADRDLVDLSNRGTNLGTVVVELVQSDTRDVRTSTFIRSWRDRLEYVPGLENLVVLSPRPGPPGRDIEIRLSGGDRMEVKNAALALAEYLRNMPGVYGISDNTSFGRQQQILTLTDLGHALGLTINDVSRQLRTAVEGQQLQSFTTRYQDVEVNLSLPEDERNHLSELENIHIILPSGESAPLLDVVVIESARGFDQLSHSKGEFNIEVSASVDSTIANTTQILQELETQVKPEFTQTYGIKWSVGSRQEDQQKTEESMKYGAMVALLLIYLALTWIFGSYFWPLFVMLAIPFGVVGAAWGHFILNLPFTLISVLGLIGLSGIVVNNAIVLVVYYRDNRDQGSAPVTAMVDAGCQRLRPVLLASITTIVGLLPLLFETSTQAQFLIPMVATLVFGLSFSALLVLFLIPAVLTLYERGVMRWRHTEKSAAALETDQVT